MPSDTEMQDDWSPPNDSIALDPAIAALVEPRPDRVCYKGRIYLRHPGVRAISAASPIWNLGRVLEELVGPRANRAAQR
jgi:hypothetical protein